MRLSRWFFVEVGSWAISGWLIVGCSPEPSNHGTTLDSHLFSRVEIIGTPGTGVGQLNKPRSVALDREDNLFVVDMTGRVQKFSPRGEVLTSWRMPETDLGKPKGMCRDLAGNIVIVEPHYQRVNHFTPTGQLVAQWGGHGTNLGQFALPRSVAVNSRGELFVSEYTTVDRVQGFSAQDKKPILCFGRPGTGDGEFNRAEGVGTGPDDRIYVADSCNHRIQIFSSQGQWLKTYGRAGRGLGELSYPYDVQVDAQGRQYVCEFGNSRIQVFDAQNQPLEILGGVGSAPGRFNNPWSLALDSKGNLYVADSGNHRVQKFVRK
jgi:DNA-binding beta-propeller fold protein YncE